MIAHQLIETYHNKCLIPDTKEKAQIQSRIDRIINAFQHSSHFAPMEVYIAGSFKKGTMLAGRGEADIEFFYKSKNVHFASLQREAVRILVSWP